MLWLNNVDYSNNVADLTLNYSSEVLDATRMGDDTRRKKGGLFNWSVAGKVHQDFAAAQAGANFFALVGTTTCFELRPLNSCSTAINPSYSGVGLLVSAPQVAGAVGSLLDMAFMIDSVGSLTRASSS